MLKFSSSRGLLAKFALGLTLAAALGACGGGGGSAPPVQVSTADATSAVTSTTIAALVTPTPTVASFATGFSGTDNTVADALVVVPGPATVSFTSSSAFEITSGGATASGITTFGSCIFTVTASTFGPTSPLALGKVVKVNPCSLTASTSGANADGLPVVRDVVLVLGAVSSTPVKLDVTVNADGTVVIGTTEVDSVTLTAATGASS